MKYRSKIIEKEAMQFKSMDDYFKIVEWMKQSGDTFALANEVKYLTPIMLIQTLEGTMAASPGDYIIKGINGEFYPCKPDIFEKTYELVSE